MMVGRAVSLNIDRPEAKYRDLRLEVKGLNCKNAEGVATLSDVGFQAFGGEILGIAGIAGSGQKELLEAIAGLQKAESGHVFYYPPHPKSDIAGNHMPVDKAGEELLGKTPDQIQKVGVALAFVPEDRLGMGLVGGMGMVDNMMLKTYKKTRAPWWTASPPGPWPSGSLRSWRSSPPASPPRCAACPAATCRRCWWAGRSPPSLRCS